MINYLNIKKVLVTIGFLPILLIAQSTSTTNEFTLQGAIDYAIKHNASYQNAEIDIKLAEYKNREIIGIGLPQINGSVDLKDYLKIPTSILPNFVSPSVAAVLMQNGVMPYNPSALDSKNYDPIAAQFGTKYNLTAGVSISQLIFSSDYFVGLQAAKEFKLLSQKSLTRTKTETSVTVTKAYYSALINRERVKTLTANIERVKKMYDDVKALNDVGFVEKIDKDRLELAYNNLLIEKEKIERLIGLSETLLKFQMGYPLQDPITLSDEIKAEQFQDVELGTPLKVKYELRSEYSLLESQKKINELDLKRYRLAYLPTIVGYGAFNYQAQRSEFNFLDKHDNWYPIAVVGATINIPIFSGGQKYYRTQQAKLNLQKTVNTIEYMKTVIDLETTAASISYKNAYVSMQTQTKNKELAKSIYDTAKKKYEAGVGSSLELINAETSLKEAETNYLNAVYDLIIAKTDLDKAQGNIK